MKKGRLQRSKSWAPSNCQTNSIPASCRSAAAQPAGVGFYRAKRRTKPRVRDLLEAAHALLDDSKGGLRQTVRNTLAPLSESAFARSLRPARRCATSPLRDVGHCTRRATRRNTGGGFSLLAAVACAESFRGEWAHRSAELAARSSPYWRFQRAKSRREMFVVKRLGERDGVEPAIGISRNSQIANAKAPLRSRGSKRTA